MRCSKKPKYGLYRLQVDLIFGEIERHSTHKKMGLSKKKKKKKGKEHIPSKLAEIEKEAELQCHHPIGDVFRGFLQAVVMD